MPVHAYEATNYLGVPAALAVNEAPPAGIGDQRFLVTLTGVAIANLKGVGAEWSKETMGIYPTDQADAWRSIIFRYNLPLPPGNENSDYYLGFEVHRYSIFASLNAVFDANHSVNAGFAVDRWRIRPYYSVVDVFTGSRRLIYQGIDVDLAVRDVDAWLYRVGYHITLLGKVVVRRPG